LWFGGPSFYCYCRMLQPIGRGAVRGAASGAAISAVAGGDVGVGAAVGGGIGVTTGAMRANRYRRYSRW
jgi:hypothetical protein